jgi:hypothetical protein
MDEIEALSNDELLAQINTHDPYDAEFVRRFRALEARIAKADALAGWVEGIIEDGCPVCGGDCSSANPPLAYCPMREAMNDLAAYREGCDT